MAKYKAVLIGLKPVATTVVVEAKSEAEAREKAFEEATNWEDDTTGDLQDVEVDSIVRLGRK